MKSIFRATAILSGSSIASILVSLCTAKVMALCLKPAGYGYYGLLQNFVMLASLATGVGMATGIVRLAAGAVKLDDLPVVAAIRHASWWLFAATGAVAFAVLAVFRGRFSEWALGSASHGAVIVILTVPLLLTVAKNIYMGTLNAYHRVGTLARCAVFSSLFSAGVVIPMVLLFGLKGVVPAVTVDSLIACAVYRHYLRRTIGSVLVRPAAKDTANAAWSLLRFGGPYTASMLVGTGVQLALPMLVLHMLNAESVGYYRAATAISVGYLGFLVNAMTQDYYPRVSAAANKPGVLVQLVNEQHRLVMLAAVPMILGALALVPYLVPLMYSVQFRGSVDILEWQIIGDLFRFSAWTMTCVILARSRPSKYLLTELIGGAASIGSTWMAVRWFGISGLGIGFLAGYIIYYLGAWLMTKSELLPLVWTAANKRAMLIGIGASLLIRVLPATPIAAWRTPIALALALAIGIPNARIIWQEFRGTPKEPAVPVLGAVGQD
jgi:enterobacterial common antigen flippase